MIHGIAPNLEHSPPDFEVLDGDLLSDRPGKVYRLRAWGEPGWEWDVGVRIRSAEELRVDGQPAAPGAFYWLLTSTSQGPIDDADAATFLCFRWSSGVTLAAGTDELCQRLEAALVGPRERGHEFTAGDQRYPLSAELFRDIEILRPGDSRIPPGRWPPTPASLLTITPFPQELHQQTAQEVKYFARALADGPRGTDWSDVTGQIALEHEVSTERYRPPFRVRVEGHPLLGWLGVPHTVDSLREELRHGGVPAALLAHVVIAGTLERANKNRLYLTADLDDLIEAIGWKPHSTAEREERRQFVWRWLLLFSAMPVIGRRHGRYLDRLTGEVLDTTIREALITLPGREDAVGGAEGDSDPPLRVTIGAGPWVDRFRDDHRILTYFGDVRKIAAIPAGRTPGAWAQCIALALHQLWREQAADVQVAHVGQDKVLTVRLSEPFTRPRLLGLFPPSPPTPTGKELLYGPDPKRAWDYWDEAVDILKHRCIIGYYRETPPRSPAKRGRDNGRQDEWERQQLDVRPAADGKQAMATIAEKAKEARAKRKKATTRAAPAASQ